MRHPSRRLSSVLIVLVAGLGVLVSPLWAQGKLDYIGKFQQPNMLLSVATFTQGAAKVGLLHIEAGSSKNSFAFDQANDWSKLIALVTKAAKARSPGNNWTVVGAMTEHGTTDVSHLVISAGAGLRFALNSPKGASVTYVLPDGDLPRFQNALGRVKQYLVAP